MLCFCRGLLKTVKHLFAREDNFHLGGGKLVKLHKDVREEAAIYG